MFSKKIFLEKFLQFRCLIVPFLSPDVHDASRFFPEIWNLTLQDEGQVSGRFSLHSWKKEKEREKMDDAPKVAGSPIQLHSRSPAEWILLRVRAG